MRSIFRERSARRPRSWGVALLLVFLLFSCGRGEVSAERWNGMSQEEKNLIVKSLVGAEMVAARKGGTPATYSGSAEDYVKKIDAAYIRGDDRPVEDIWQELAD